LAQVLELVEKSKWNTIFRLDIPVGNFEMDYHSRGSVYFENFPAGQTKMALPFTVQPKFSSGYVCKW